MKTVLITYKENEMTIMENHCFQTIVYSDIMAIVYDSPYAAIHTAKGYRLVSISLAKLMRNLPENFIICNRATIINIRQIELYKKKEGILRLKNGQTHPVSVRRRSVIEKILRSTL